MTAAVAVVAVVLGIAYLAVEAAPRGAGAGLSLVMFGPMVLLALAGFWCLVPKHTRCLGLGLVVGSFLSFCVVEVAIFATVGDSLS